MGKRVLLLLILLVLVGLSFPGPAGAQSNETPSLRAVFFFSPTCGHCHLAISDLLLPMLAQYGAQLQIAACDTSQPAGDALYQATVDQWEIPKEHRGVPMLVVQDQVLIGSVQIPSEFPALVEDALAAGDTGWPEIPGLVPLLDQADQQVLSSAPGATPTAPAASEETPPAPAGPRGWAIPALCLVGLGVASYLAYVEVNQVEAICGPVGRCNIVQSSEYALFLGVPVAVWGVLNYLAVAGLWVGGRALTGRWADRSLMGLLALTLFGVLFSIYLTCLELFAIHAICAWCLGSAVTTAALLLLVVVPLTDLKTAPARVKRRRRLT